MIDLPTALLLGLVLLLAGFLLGWDLSVHNFRAEKKQLETAARGLETEIANLHALAARDPQRAWINVGKDSVLVNVERYLAQLRNALEPPS